MSGFIQSHYFTLLIEIILMRLLLISSQWWSKNNYFHIREVSNFFGIGHKITKCRLYPFGQKTFEK